MNLNHYDGSGSCIRWHSDNESLFGPQDSPKLIVSLSLGNPVEFKVRRVLDSVTSSVTVLGLTLLTVGLRNTLRPVLSQA